MCFQTSTIALDKRHSSICNWTLISYTPIGVGILALTGFVGYRLEYNHRKRFILDYQVELSRRKQREILDTMLPVFVVDKMLNNEMTEDGIPMGLVAEDRGTVSVVFCDVSDFQSMVAGLEPTQLVKVLDSLFLCFDRCAEQFGCSKIETVFESYVAAAGLRPGRGKHGESEFPQSDAFDGLEMSIAMLQVAMYITYELDHEVLSLNPLSESFNSTDKFSIKRNSRPRDRTRRIRVKLGIHSGRVISGVVGAKKPQYALFGDTVNTASRMKSTGEVDRIHVSSDTHNLVQDDKDLKWEYRQTKVKGKGIMDTFLLVKVEGCEMYSKCDDDSLRRMGSGLNPMEIWNNNAAFFEKRRSSRIGKIMGSFISPSLNLCFSFSEAPIFFSGYDSIVDEHSDSHTSVLPPSILPRPSGDEGNVTLSSVEPSSLMSTVISPTNELSCSNNIDDDVSYLNNSSLRHHHFDSEAAASRLSDVSVVVEAEQTRLPPPSPPPSLLEAAWGKQMDGIWDSLNFGKDGGRRRRKEEIEERELMNSFSSTKGKGYGNSDDDDDDDHKQRGENDGNRFLIPDFSSIRPLHFSSFSSSPSPFPSPSSFHFLAAPPRIEFQSLPLHSMRNSVEEEEGKEPDAIDNKGDFPPDSSPVISHTSSLFVAEKRRMMRNMRRRETRGIIDEKSMSDNDEDGKLKKIYTFWRNTFTQKGETRRILGRHNESSRFSLTSTTAGFGRLGRGSLGVTSGIRLVTSGGKLKIHWIFLNFLNNDLEERYQHNFYSNKTQINTVEQALVIFLMAFVAQTAVYLTLDRVTSVGEHLKPNYILTWIVRSVFTLAAFSIWLLMHFRAFPRIARLFGIRWLIFLLNLVFITAAFTLTLSNTWSYGHPDGKPEWLIVDTMELYFFITIIHHNSGLLFQHVVYIILLLLAIVITLLLLVAEKTSISTEALVAIPIFSAANSLSAYLKEHFDRLTFVVSEEMQKSEIRGRQLLCDMLPKQVLEEFQQDKLQLAYNHEDMSFLFADICGFTSWSNSVDATEVISMLQYLFAKFDHDSTMLGIYKLCTIGDAYVAVSEPVTGKNTDFDPVMGAEKIIEMGEMMIKNVKDAREMLKLPDLEMRIGLHYGSCVGGVIGSGRLRYDIWGLDVLTANIMESSGLPGHICVSEAFKDFVESYLPPQQYCFQFHRNVWIIDRYVKVYILHSDGLNHPNTEEEELREESQEEMLSDIRTGAGGEPIVKTSTDVTAAVPSSKNKSHISRKGSFGMHHTLTNLSTNSAAIPSGLRRHLPFRLQNPPKYFKGEKR